MVVKIAAFPSPVTLIGPVVNFGAQSDFAAWRCAVDLPQVKTYHECQMPESQSLIGQTISHYHILGEAEKLGRRSFLSTQAIPLRENLLILAAAEERESRLTIVASIVVLVCPTSNAPRRVPRERARR